MAVTTKIWSDTYYDSVTLMLGSSMISALPGIDEAMVLMGTDRNKTVIRASGLIAEGTGSFGPNDIVIGIRSEDEAAARAMGERAASTAAAFRVDCVMDMWREAIEGASEA